MSKIFSVMIFLLAVLVLNNSCEKQATPKTETANYVRAIQKWHTERLARLKANDGWLSLAGLYWLEEGANSFGGDSTNTIIFPPEKAPAQLGVIFKEGKVVRVKIQPGVKVTSQGNPVEETVIFEEGMEKPVVLEYGPLSWYVIKRGTRLGIRLKDSENPAITQLKEIPTFPVDPDWNVKARLERYESPKKIPIENILGMVIEEDSPGQLVFQIKGQTYRLETLDSGDELFILFTDQTSGEETYGAGRYLYVPKPQTGDETRIDFNKAYNPPCAFTDYATCPLPPPQNHLSLRITAGEKYAGGAHHKPAAGRH